MVELAASVHHAHPRRVVLSTSKAFHGTWPERDPELIPLDVLPGPEALSEGAVTLSGEIVRGGQTSARVEKDGFVRARSAQLLGRVHHGHVYQRTSASAERHLGSVAAVSTREHLFVYVYDPREAPLGFLLFARPTLPADDPQLPLRLAGAALLCCHVDAPR